MLFLCLTGVMGYGQTPVNGDYRSKAGVTGSWNDTSSWERYNGSVWVNATAAPTVDTDVTITAGSTITIPGAYTTGNKQKIIVNGTLLVEGNFTTGNQSVFTMGGSAVVIIEGNFSCGNLIDINISSYLIVKGSFTKSGSSTQGDLSVNNAHIYIFEDATGWPSTFQPCPTYDGTTDGSTTEECDFGDEEDFVDHYDEFPQDVVDLLKKCTEEVSHIDDQSGCAGESITFSITPIPGASFQWKFKALDEDSWINIAGAESDYLILNNISSANIGYYRVVVTSGTCVIPSNAAELTVLPGSVGGTATAAPSTICSGSNTTITLSGFTGNIQWQQSPNGMDSWINVTDGAGGTTAVYTTANLSSTTYFRAVVTNGTCTSANSNTVQVTVNMSSVAPTSITGTKFICDGESTTLTVANGSLGSGAGWKWYSGSCGGTTAGTGASITVSPTETTTYYVRAEGTCNTTECVSTEVTVLPIPVTGELYHLTNNP